MLRQFVQSRFKTTWASDSLDLNAAYFLQGACRGTSPPQGAATEGKTHPAISARSVA
ncbi:unnamed protein product, partial [Iphiclides podalirius]